MAAWPSNVGTLSERAGMLSVSACVQAAEIGIDSWETEKPAAGTSAQPNSVGPSANAGSIQLKYDAPISAREGLARQAASSAAARAAELQAEAEAAFAAIEAAGRAAAAANEAAGLAAAQLLDEERQAAEAAQRAKERGAAKKARQKQRKKVR